jgi:hypothetical protein
MCDAILVCLSLSFQNKSTNYDVRQPVRTQVVMVVLFGNTAALLIVLEYYFKVLLYYCNNNNNNYGHTQYVVL